MIKKIIEVPHRESAIIYESQFEQVKEMFNDGDVEEAFEYLWTVVEVAFNLEHEVSTDNKWIKRMINDFEVVAEKNKKKYVDKQQATKEKKIKELQLDVIADLYNRGATQTAIANQLKVSKQVISYRLNNIIFEDYPELLEKAIDEDGVIKENVNTKAEIEKYKKLINNSERKSEIYQDVAGINNLSEDEQLVVLMRAYDKIC